MAQVLKQGDYVLATKYRSGDPLDHWCVGFFLGMNSQHELRFDIVDANGNIFRGNGFKRAKKISKEKGTLLLAHSLQIEWSGKSVWYWERNIKKLIKGETK
jgi:hypothetical protein